MTFFAWQFLLFPLVAAPLGTLAEAPGRPAPLTAPASGTKEARIERAYKVFGERRHVESSLEFEGLWRDFPEARFLFNAGVSRFAARHYAHAIAYLEQYLQQPDSDAEGRAEAKAQIAIAMRDTQTVSVALQVAPITASPVRLEAEHVSQFSSDVRPSLELPVDAANGKAGRKLDLDPGEWKVSAICPDGTRGTPQSLRVTKGQPSRVELAVDCSQKSVGVEPTDGRANREGDSRQTFVIATGALGGVATLAGAIVTGVYGKRMTEHLNSSCVGDACIYRYVELQRPTSAGAAVLGTGVGLLAGGMTGLIANPRRRRTAWIAEAGAGGALLIAGLVVRNVGVRAQNRLRNEVGQHDGWLSFLGNASLITTMDLLAGIGAGAVLGASSGLLLEHLAKQRASRRMSIRHLRASALVGPVTGVVLTGRF